MGLKLKNANVVKRVNKQNCYAIEEEPSTKAAITRGVFRSRDVDVMINDTAQDWISETSQHRTWGTIITTSPIN